MKTVRHILVGFLLAGFCATAASADALDDLANDFWLWRANQMPISGDDIPRLDRPAGWVGDWSPAAVAKYRSELLRFEERWRAIKPSKSAPIAWKVDHRLMGSAIARVRWELEITRNWQRSPYFYIDQTMGSVFLALLQPPPFTEERSAEIIRYFEAFPRHAAAAKQNLTDARAPFARLAIAELKEVRPRLQTVAQELKPLLASAAAERLDAIVEKGIASLEEYRMWLEKRLPSMPQKANVGRAGYVFFLQHVALVPHTPEELAAMGRQEWERAVSFEVYEANRNADLPKLELFRDQSEQMAREEKNEKEIRDFLEAKNLLTVPNWVQHYRNLPMPAYLKPLASLGVTDDLTSPNRLKENGISYINPPSPQMGYFAASTARDPRPIIVHEGVPGHYLQKVLSWANEDPIRRHYYDSVANEGIGFYAEEMMLQAGLWDDSPRSREIVYNFMRLRALRVEVDVKIALGTFTIEQAADYFATMVPMDRETALEESLLYASNPGVAISYQTGKLQILRFLAEAKRARGDKFNLRHFHDFVWMNGNVPIALQKWEYLGKNDELVKLRTDTQVVPQAR
jgi:uncharacterized protein (DUF885 family)